MKLPSSSPTFEIADPPDASTDPWAGVRSALARSKWARSKDRSAMVATGRVLILWREADGPRVEVLELGPGGRLP